MRNSWVSRLVTLVVLSAFFTPHVAGRILFPERNGRAILHPRRILSTSPVVDELAKACPGATCANLAGAFISTVLASAAPCAQQDACDNIIDQSKQFDAGTQARMVSLAKQLRTIEKNSQPNFTTQPPTKRNTLFCDKCPRNAVLFGLNQAQDPDNDPNIFVNPVTGQDVIKGTQPDTEPFKGPCPNSTTASNSSLTSNNNTAVTNKTATHHNAATNKTGTTNNDHAVTNKTDKTNSLASVCKPVEKVSGSPASSSSPPSSTTPSKNDTSLLKSSASGADFGSCSIPEIIFAAGLDGRKETAFAPKDKASYNHGSADNIGVISDFMCLALTNTCNANEAAKTLCDKAKAAASAATPPQTGAQADAFNEVFGIKTNFKAVTPISNTGQPIGSSTPSNNITSLVSSSASNVSFGTCSPPQIKFAAGLDGRKETAFVAVDQVSFPHGSAQAIDNIVKFICDELTNKCGANQQAKDVCATAEAAAEATTPPKSGAQADKFNSFFGFNTNFKAVTPLDDHGQPVGGSGSTQPNNGTASTASSPNFGSCSTPQIKFAPGLDGRKETAFAPADQASYNHGSADNIGVISDFICLALTNSCNANEAAKTLCDKAKAAASAATPPLSGAQADAFNGAFGIKTDFSSVTPISNTGVPVKSQ